MTRRVTPTGSLVYSGPPHTPEWFAARRAGITGTDLPKILGLSPYGTALDVWADKRGLLPPEDAGEAAHWGTLLEDVVAREWAARNGRKIRRVGIIANLLHPWQRISLDRLVVGAGDELLEVKTRSQYKADEWRGEDTPDDVLAQVQWGLTATGCRVAHIAVLLGGQTFEQRVVEHDPDLAAYLVAEAEKVWQHVQDGTEPPVPASPLTTSLYERLYPDPDGDVEVVGGESEHDVLAAMFDYRSLGQEIAERVKAREQAKAVMVMALRGRQRGLVNGKPAYSFKASVRKGYTVAESTTHTFRILKESA